jgi:hypothetical protein
MPSTFTIKTRQYLALGFVALLLTAGAGVAAWQLDAIGQRAKAVRADTRLAAAVAQVNGGLRSLSHHEHAYFLNTALLRPAKDDLARWNEAHATVGKGIDGIGALTGTGPTAPLRTA